MDTIVFGAHPDDAEIGAGGIISKLIKNGSKVLLVIATIPNNKEVRTQEAQNASDILGCELNILNLDCSKYFIEIANKPRYRER